MQPAINLTASVFVVPVAPPLVPAGTDLKNISPAPAQPRASLASAGIGQKNTFPESAQPEAPNLSTAASEITPSALAAQLDSIGVGTDNDPPTPTNPQVFFHSEAADVGSQASPAQPQTTSRQATANRAPVPVEPQDFPQLPSISQARLPSLVPSNLISTRTRRRYGFSRPNPASPPANQPLATARLPRRPRLPSPSRKRPACPTDSALTARIGSALTDPIGSAAAAIEPFPTLLGVQSSDGTPAPLLERPTAVELAFREAVERYSHAD